MIGIAAGIAIVPGAAWLALIILQIDPNPRHPPEEIFGQAVGWAVLGGVAGALGSVIGSSTGVGGEHRGLIFGMLAGVGVAAFLGMGLAVIQMGTASGQAITSAQLGVLAGGSVGALGAIAGGLIGIIIKRAVTTWF